MPQIWIVANIANIIVITINAIVRRFNLVVPLSNLSSAGKNHLCLINSEAQIATNMVISILADELMISTVGAPQRPAP